MLKLFSFLFLFSIIGLSCNESQENISPEEEKQDTTQKEDKDIVKHFKGLSKTAKIEYFNSLNNEDKFFIMEDYLSGTCFELPISDVIKFRPDGRIQADWLIDDPKTKGLRYASGDSKPFIDYLPFNWKIKEKSLVIRKTEQYQKFENVKSEEDRIFNFRNKDVIVFNQVYISIFQNKLYFTLKNNRQELSFIEGSCEKWPVMTEEN